jgi:hypothetical protein
MMLKNAWEKGRVNPAPIKKPTTCLGGLFMSFASKDQLDDADNNDQADDENDAGRASNKLQHDVFLN